MYERGLLSNYIMTKHIALSNNSTQQQLPATNTKETATTTKLIKPTMQPVTTNRITSTTRKLLSLSPSSLSFLSSLSPLLTDSEDNVVINDNDNDEEEPTRRLHLNRTQLEGLSSLSLLSTTSLNDTTAPQLTTELKSATSSSTTASVSTLTLTFPNHSVTEAASAPATAVRHKGNEQNMHNTNSHLTVDNVNATIVATNRTKTTTATTATTITSLKQQQHNKNPTTKLSSQHTSSIAKGSSTTTSSSSSSSGSPTTSKNSLSVNATSSNSNSSSSSNSSIGEPVTATGNSSRINTGTTRISARKVDSKYILSKAHKTDAPMLNYIFDTFSSANKHHHHDQR